MPINFQTGSISSKIIHISMAVKTGRILLNTFARVTPIFRTVKQNSTKAATEAKMAKYPTASHGVMVFCSGHERCSSWSASVNPHSG